MPWHKQPEDEDDIEFTPVPSDRSVEADPIPIILLYVISLEGFVSADQTSDVIKPLLQM